MSADPSATWTVQWESPCRTTEAGFWGGLAVWIDRPYILNKRLCAVQHIVTLPVTSPLLLPGDNSECRWQRLALHLRRAIASSDDHSDLDPTEATTLLQSALDKLTGSELGKSDGDVSVVLCELLPKRPSRYRRMYKLFVKDIAATTVVFIPWKLTDDSELEPVVDNQVYAVQFVDSDSPSLRLLIHTDATGVACSAATRSCITWLGDRILPKICQWCEQEADAVDQPPRSLVTLRMVSAKDYSLLYQQLRIKYGTKLVAMWTEKTDPQKFVYEDLAIASYLLTIWRDERELFGLTQLQSFVDLGCGNGLLTHILSEEGHTGIGIDVRKRKIWDQYGGNTKLIECSIVPSSSNLFPEYDWIIGNHSDELTPWIPVIAARSSQTMRFFLLPCCAHNFDAKFQRRNSKKSKYEDYLDYIHELCDVCGFATKRDKLRIPSTKRICLIGAERWYPVEQWAQMDERISEFIAEQRSLPDDAPPAAAPSDNDCDNEQQQEAWASGFRARPTVEPVRNCTTLDIGLKEAVIGIVVDALLACSDVAQELADGRRWRAGGSIELSALAQKIRPSQLLQMKKECGGLQTLLRNHYYIFQVVRGSVTLRNYSVENPFPKKKKFKSATTKPRVRPCWFLTNHPDGCPAQGKCIFDHDETTVTHQLQLLHIN